MVKHFSKNTEKGMSFQLPAIRKLYQDACQHLMLHPYITAAAKTNMASVVGSKYLVLCTVEDGMANTRIN